MDYTDHPLREVMPLAEGFGRGARRIRIDHGLTLDRVASAASMFGLKWSTARVVEFENGRIPITIPTLMRLGTALTQLTGKGITLGDLLGWDHWLELPGQGGGVIHAEALRQALSGGAVDLRQGDEIEWARDETIRPSEVLPGVPEEMTTRLLRFGHEYAGLADERAAKSLDMTLDVFLSFALPSLGTSLTEYRDSRMRLHANAQERGRLTRRATAVVKSFAEQYSAGVPAALTLMRLYVRGDEQWRPLADSDPYIRAKSIEATRERVRRAIEYGHFDGFGLTSLDPDRLADEHWWIMREHESKQAGVDTTFEQLLGKWNLARR